MKPWWNRFADGRYNAATMGVPMMVMGEQVLAIHRRTFQQYLNLIDKEELRLRRIMHVQTSKELQSLIVALVCYLVSFCCISWADCEVLLVTGSAVFSATEGWTYFQGFYFCIVFSLTIGYVHSICMPVNPNARGIWWSRRISAAPYTSFTRSS